MRLCLLSLDISAELDPWASNGTRAKASFRKCHRLCSTGRERGSTDSGSNMVQRLGRLGRKTSHGSGQVALTNARKAETRRRKLQADLEAKQRCWAGFQQELKATFLKEHQRFQSDVLKLQEDIKEARVQEEAAKQQLVSQGDIRMEEIFPGIDCEGATGPGSVDLPGHYGESIGGFSIARSAVALDTPCSPGNLDDTELRSLLQANSGHSDVQHGLAHQRCTGERHQLAQVSQRGQPPATPLRTPLAGTPASGGSHFLSQSGGQEQQTGQDPYQLAGGMTPSAPLYFGQGMHTETTASAGDSVRGPPWQPATPPVLRKSPSTRDSSSRKPVKQFTMKPATRSSPNGPSLADKLEKLREKSGQPPPQPSTGGTVPAAVGPTAPETAQALKELRPVDLPQQFLLYDDAESDCDLRRRSRVSGMGGASSWRRLTTGAGVRTVSFHPCLLGALSSSAIPRDRRRGGCPCIFGESRVPTELVPGFELFACEHVRI